MSKLTARAIKKMSSRPSFLGPRPLLEGEDTKKYDDLLSRVTDEVKPSGAIETMAVDTFVTHTWQINWLRQIMTRLLHLNRHKGLKVILDTLYGTENSQTLADSWAARDPEAIEYVDALLAKAGYTMEDVMAQTLSIVMRDYKDIDDTLFRLEMRQGGVLREFDRRRSSIKHAVRNNVAEVEDAEFSEISPPRIGAGGTS